MADLPSDWVSTVYPSVSNRRLRAFCTAGSSSTTKMRLAGLMAGAGFIVLLGTTGVAKFPISFFLVSQVRGGGVGSPSAYSVASRFVKLTTLLTENPQFCSGFDI